MSDSSNSSSTPRGMVDLRTLAQGLVDELLLEGEKNKARIEGVNALYERITAAMAEASRSGAEVTAGADVPSSSEKLVGGAADAPPDPAVTVPGPGDTSH